MRTIVALASTAILMAPAQAHSPQEALVNAANTTLSDLRRDADMTWLQNNVGRARGVLIAASIARAGFIFGGSGGRAVPVAREGPGSKWVGPAFYTMATASVGFQAVVPVTAGTVTPSSEPDG